MKAEPYSIVDKPCVERVYLAPMEGVTDVLMRDLMSRQGGIDRCVTEFLRVTNAIFPRRVFTRAMPEIEHGGHTANGTPVYLQLLGNDPKMMAANAAKAARLGAVGIDLNFGCPAKATGTPTANWLKRP